MTLASKFAQAFGNEPIATASVPGRVNLIGEHTDYNGGAVLPAAIERRIQIALAPTDASSISIKSDRFDELVERPLGEAKRDDWTDYAMGALAKADELGWLSGGVQLFIESDVPDGAGVSSSAALVTAILRAAAEIGEASPTPIDIAKYARAVENDYIGMPCGIMDQMAVGLADYGKALSLDTRDLSYEVIDIPQGWAFVVIHSGVRRELADGRYKARFEECQKAADFLKTEMLCHLTSEQVEAINSMPDNLRRRTNHVRSEHIRTVEAASSMKACDIDTFARLMNESHLSYSKDFEASTSVIDGMVEDAIRSGAKGARLTGGGFGGCIVVLHEKTEIETWLHGFLLRHQGTRLI